MLYKQYKLVECTDYKVVYGIINLNEKHSFEEFQQAIYDAKDNFCKEGFEDWTIKDVFACDIFKTFDYEYIPTKEFENDIIEI